MRKVSLQRMMIATGLLCLSAGVCAQESVDELEPAVSSQGLLERARSERDARGPAIDEIELDRTQITGNQELPQVLYIVPWKSSELGDLIGRPVNTLLDEILAPADREVLIRELSYFDDLNGDDGSQR